MLSVAFRCFRAGDRRLLGSNGPLLSQNQLEKGGGRRRPPAAAKTHALVFILFLFRPESAIKQPKILQGTMMLRERTLKGLQVYWLKPPILCTRAI